MLTQYETKEIKKKAFAGAMYAWFSLIVCVTIFYGDFSIFSVGAHNTANASITAHPSIEETTRNISPENFTCLVRTLYGEARGQKTEEIKEIAGVIMRRLEMGTWGSTICSVVESPRQFSAYNEEDPNRSVMFRRGVETTKEWKRITKIAENVIQTNYVSKYDHYWHPLAMKKLYKVSSPWWADKCLFTQKIGIAIMCQQSEG